MRTSREDRIRERAHQLWVTNGSPENLAEQFWLLAERQLAEESAAKAEQDAPGQLDEDVTGRESGRSRV